MTNNPYPLPAILRGNLVAGALRDVPKRCQQCPDRRCGSAPPQLALRECHRGVNYVRVDDGTTLIGFAAQDGSPVISRVRRAFLREEKARLLSRDEIERLLEWLREADERVAGEVAVRTERAISAYMESEGYKEEVLDLLRPSVQQALSQVHDYRTFVSQIIQNVNVIWQSRHPGQELEWQLDHAPQEELAIYWAARLMESKLTAALFLMYPERIDHGPDLELIRLHGLITKYWKIYEPSFRNKELHVTTRGESFGSVLANPDAVGTIPHAFLDNALKYSPRGGAVIVTFEERSNEILYSVQSQGPPIEPNEEARIFDLFYRGRHARTQVSEGTGFGLALAKIVADRIGASLTVSQNRKIVNGATGLFPTTFTAVFQKASDPTFRTRVRQRRT